MAQNPTTEHPTNDGEGEQALEAVHNIPTWMKIALAGVIFFFATWQVAYTLGHDAGVEDGSDRYAVTVGTVASRLPFTCRESFLNSLRQEMRETKGDR